MNIIYKFDKGLKGKKSGFCDVIVKNIKVINGNIHIILSEEKKNKSILSCVNWDIYILNLPNKAYLIRIYYIKDMPQKLKIEEILRRVEELKKRYPQISLDTSTYRNLKTKCRWIDSEYGEWFATPKNVLNIKTRHPKRAL